MAIKSKLKRVPINEANQMYLLQFDLPIQETSSIRVAV